jgi:hyaluronan-mediated motility receptor
LNIEFTIFRESLGLKLTMLETENAKLETRSREVEGLYFQLGNVQADNAKLSKEKQALESLIEPFKDQLTSYELEVRMEKEGKVASEEKLKELLNKYAGVLGHQNNKQKIQHIMNLKEENVRYRKV